jgi:poly-gamma-glutamate capsule biosynthesis protein CapA/YwtB (metallophosphatase superfamily)
MGVRWRTAVLTLTFCAIAAGPHPNAPPPATRSPVAAEPMADATETSSPLRHPWTDLLGAAVHTALIGSPVVAPVGALGIARPPRMPTAAEAVTPPVEQSPEPVPPPREVTVAVTGDLLPHQPVLDAAWRGDSYDFVSLLRGIRGPISRADLALCHLEVPLARGHEGLSTYPVFNGPPELATALAAVGYDGCSVASNHAFDQGETGVRSTLDVLDQAGLGHAGTARTKHEARVIQRYEVDSVQIAHLSYTYGLNGFTLPSGRAWLVDLIDARRILRDARQARRDHADVVLVSLHWGTEYVAEPTSDQVRLARRLLASAHIDALIGHHAHVVQPVDRVAGKVVVYGLGNLLSNQSAACCAAATQDGVVVELTLRGADSGPFTVTRVRYRPTMVRFPQRKVVLVEPLLDRTDDAELRRQLQASLRRTRAIIGDIAEPATGS